MDYQLSAQEALARVNDPNTPGAMLQTIATQYPSLWPQIATHPQAYPELLAWLDAQKPVNADAVTAPLPAVPAMIDQSMPDPMLQPVQQAPAWPVYAQPTPPRDGISRPMLALIIVLAVALVAAISVFASLLLAKPTPPAGGPSAPQPPASSAPTSTTAPVITVTQTETVFAPTQQQPDPEDVAYQNLIAQTNADFPQVQAHLQDLWTNLLATKKAGTLADGSVWSYQDIWNLYTSFKQSYPSAVLVRGNTYASANLGPEWFLIASGVQFGSADSALAWCTGFYYTDDQCFAFRFTDTPGTNSKHQG